MKRTVLFAFLAGSLVFGVVFCGWPLRAAKAQEEKADALRSEATSDLLGLHAAAVKYIEDQGHWPQMDANLDEIEEREYFAFWMDALKPYGATEEMWKHSADQSEGKCSYIPTIFDAQPVTPYRWEQPWFIARTSFGGQGHFVIMPNGEVIDSSESKSKELTETEPGKDK